MSDLRIVKGNDFATLYTIRAMYADGTIVEDFDLRACTDVQVIVHRTYSKSVASLLSANEYGSYSLEPENVLRINWDGLLVKLGTYTVDFRAKFRGADIRSYSIKDLIFDIVETNEEANIPAGAFVDNGTYRFSGEFVLMFESQVQADWTEADTHSKSYIKNKPTSLVEDENYVHTDNNFSYEEKQKLSTLENYDDTGVKGLINTEKQRAESVEEGLSTSINNIGRVIPAQASQQNQLADKEFVNHSIATNTANFKGTYNSVVELSNITDATNNDYAFVIVTDAQGNQFYDRYKYNGTTWLYEYRVESTAFTAQQWAAIQSGITSVLVAKLSDLPTNEALQEALTLINTTLSGKQDTISDLAEIRSGAEKGATAYQKPSGGISYDDLSKDVTDDLSYGYSAYIDVQHINGLIPTQASKTNQLADKDFVNSSISTNTAYYISNNGQPFTSLAQLQAYSGPLTNNDYAFVVGTDAAGNTTYTRYKYNADTQTWAEEYVLNNSSFTAAQWSAINSAITSGDVEKLAALPTKAQLDAMLAAKQDTLTFDNLPTKNSNNPVKSGGVFTALGSKAEKVRVEQKELKGDMVLMIEANTIYELTYNTVIDIALGFPTSTEKCEYCIKFDVASTIPTLSLPSDIIWAEDIELEANTHYVLLINYENGRFYGDWKSYPLT